MSETVLASIYNALVGSASLSDLVDGRIFTVWSLKGEIPRIILSLDLDRQNSLIAGGSLEVDIFSDANDIVKMERIREAVEDALEFEVFHPIESGPTLRAFLTSSGTVQEPDDTMAHWSMTFSLRYYRRRALNKTLEGQT